MVHISLLVLSFTNDKISYKTQALCGTFYKLSFISFFLQMLTCHTLQNFT
jgi:hypothetical protein